MTKTFSHDFTPPLPPFPPLPPLDPPAECDELAQQAASRAATETARASFVARLSFILNPFNPVGDKGRVLSSEFCGGLAGLRPVSLLVYGRGQPSGTVVRLPWPAVRGASGPRWAG